MISWSLETPLKQPANVFCSDVFLCNLIPSFLVFPWAMPRVTMLPSHWCLYLSKSKLKSGPAIWSRVRKRERSALPRKLFNLPAPRNRKSHSRMIFSFLHVKGFFPFHIHCTPQTKNLFFCIYCFLELGFCRPLGKPYVFFNYELYFLLSICMPSIQRFAFLTFNS